LSVHRLHSWVVGLLLPQPRAYDKHFGWPTLVLCLVLLVIIVFATPPVRDYVLENCLSAEQRHQYFLDKIRIVGWIEWSRVTAETILAVVIRGQIFAAGLSRKFHDSIEKYAQKRPRILEKQRIQIKSRVSEIEQTIIEISEKGDLKDLPSLFKASHALSNIYFKDIPPAFRLLIFVQFYSVFPGGLYGLLVYTVFLAIVILKIAKQCMDSGVMQ
jgi:hypothetical protein